MDEKLASLLSQTGFPIVVSCWFLWRLEKRLERILRSIARLEGRLRVPADKAEDDEEP